MAQKENGKYLPCPMAKLQNIIAGKWKIYILWILSHQTIRFGQLHRMLGEITQSTLTKQLRELEKDGFITRKIHYEVPLKVEYSLSSMGEKFVPILQNLNHWATEHLNNGESKDFPYSDD